MTVPLSTRQDIRELDATGVSRCEIARRLDVSRNTVARYADMADMSPAPPVTSVRPHPATDAHADWIDSVLSADRGAPRKQRHTAKRIYDRLVAERGYEGSYESVRRYVAAWRREHGALASELAFPQTMDELKAGGTPERLAPMSPWYAAGAMVLIWTWRLVISGTASMGSWLNWNRP